MKKLLSLSLAVILVIACVPVVTALNYNGFVYTDNGNGTCSITGYNDFYEEDVVIPSTINDLTVTSITGFRQKSSIRYVSIPNTVETIAAYAFYGCRNLYSVVIGTGVKTIGDHAFNSCPKLSGINVRNAEVIGEYAFYNCSSLTELFCGSALKSIGTRAFSNCKELNYIRFSNTLETIGDYAFSNCKMLPSLSFPDSLTSIGISAFSCCLALETLTFGNGPLTINMYAFENCTLLTEVTIPATVKHIGKKAFAFRETDSTEFTHTVKINCNLGSAGVIYSIQNNAPVYIIELGKEISNFGDVDGDNKVTTVDARKALRCAAGIVVQPTDAETLLLGDLNQNGYFDLDDATNILQRATGI